MRQNPGRGVYQRLPVFCATLLLFLLCIPAEQTDPEPDHLSADTASASVHPAVCVDSLAHSEHHSDDVSPVLRMRHIAPDRSTRAGLGEDETQPDRTPSPPRENQAANDAEAAEEAGGRSPPVRPPPSAASTARCQRYVHPLVYASLDSAGATISSRSESLRSLHALQRTCHFERVCFEVSSGEWHFFAAAASPEQSSPGCSSSQSPSSAADTNKPAGDEELLSADALLPAEQLAVQVAGYKDSPMVWFRVHRRHDGDDYTPEETSASSSPSSSVSDAHSVFLGLSQVRETLGSDQAAIRWHSMPSLLLGKPSNMYYHWVLDHLLELYWMQNSTASSFHVSSTTFQLLYDASTRDWPVSTHQHMLDRYFTSLPVEHLRYTTPPGIDWHCFEHLTVGPSAHHFGGQGVYQLSDQLLRQFAESFLRTYPPSAAPATSTAPAAPATSTAPAAPSTPTPATATTTPSQSSIDLSPSPSASTLDHEHLLDCGTERDTPALQQTSPSSLPRILLLQRQSDRLLLNADQLMHSLRSHFGSQYRVCFSDRFHSLDHAHQLGILRETQILISVHGSGLVNMLWLGTHAVVLELFPYKFHRPSYQNLAHALNIGYLSWKNPSFAGTRFHAEILNQFPHLSEQDKRSIRRDPQTIFSSWPANLYWINQDTTVDIHIVQALITQAVRAIREGRSSTLIPPSLLQGRDSDKTQVISERFE